MLIIKKKIYKTGGMFSLSLGVLGIFVPLLPTTPFLLLSAWCFSNSSKKWQNWLEQHAVLGKYLSNYREKKGMSPRHKYFSLLFLWIGIGYTIFLYKDSLSITTILIVTLISITFHIYKLKTIKGKHITNNNKHIKV